MGTSLFKHERIRTTDVKAKELRRWADNLITLAKRGDLHARRQALAIVREKEVVHKLFENAAQRFGLVSGGYTRITKLGRRPGDAAPISMIELISVEPEKKKKRKKKKKAVPAVETRPAPKDTDANEKAVKEKAEIEKPSEEQLASTEAVVEARSEELAEAAEEKSAAAEPEPFSEEGLKEESKVEEQAAAAVEPEAAKTEEPETEKSEDKPEDPESQK